MLYSLCKLFEHKCVTHSSYNDNNLPSVLKSPFSNEAVQRFLSELCSSVKKYCEYTKIKLFAASNDVYSLTFYEEII